jgi:hypothetical protein
VADSVLVFAPIRVLTLLIGVTLALSAATAWAGGEDKPEIKATGVTSVSYDSAVVNGRIKPRGLATTFVVEYGETKAYGATTAPISIGSGTSEVPITATVAGLQPETTYHFRLVATNSKGTVRGPDKTFKTITAPADPGSDPGTDPGTNPGPDPGTDPGGDPDTDPGLKAPEAPPEAKLGESVLVAPATGELRVRLPGHSGFTPLELGSKLPVGAEIDARAGSIALTSALPSGKSQTGYFGGGRFKLAQDKRGYVDLYLRGRYCTRAERRALARRSQGSAIASAAASRSKRRLWGRDHGGRFRTHGRNSHATVRGTRWVVIDTCKGTLTRVSEGSVVVRDTVRHKRVVLDARERYLARPPKR